MNGSRKQALRFKKVLHGILKNAKKIRFSKKSRGWDVNVFDKGFDRVFEGADQIVDKYMNLDRKTNKKDIKYDSDSTDLPEHVDPAEA
jgi:hypothetical protein